MSAPLARNAVRARSSAPVRVAISPNGWWPTLDGASSGITVQPGASDSSASRTAATFAGFVDPIAARANRRVTGRAYGPLAGMAGAR